MGKTMTATAAPEAVPDACWNQEQIYNPDTTCENSFDAWEAYCRRDDAAGCDDHWDTLINIVFGLDLDPELKKMLAKRVSLMGKARTANESNNFDYSGVFGGMAIGAAAAFIATKACRSRKNDVDFHRV